jgi:hypothetical protein
MDGYLEFSPANRAHQLQKRTRIAQSDRVVQNVVIKPAVSQHMFERRSFPGNRSISQDGDFGIRKMSPDQVQCRQYNNRISKASEAVNENTH